MDNDLREWLKNGSDDFRALNDVKPASSPVHHEPALMAVPATNAQEITFVVPMQITGKARPRLGGRPGSKKRAFMPTAYKDWAAKFRLYVPDAFWQLPEGMPAILDIIVIRAFPKRTSKKRRREFYGTVCMAGADRDNAIGSVMDVLWNQKKDGRNDRVVVSANCTAVWGNTHKIIVTVRVVPETHKPYDIETLKRYDDLKWSK